MKVLCVASFPPKLQAGKIYTVISRITCPQCNQLYYGVSELARIRCIPYPYCPKCMHPMPKTELPHFKSWRFVPWKPETLGITEKDANDLYLPEPRIPTRVTV